MNERIKSLLVECGAELVKGTHNGRIGTAVNLPVGRMFDFEKFAELIVQDCANFVRETYDHEAAESIAWTMEINYGLHGDYA